MTDPAEGYRWRIISPNGRGIARGARAYRSPDHARRAIEEIVEGIDGLTPSFRITADYRWTWTATLGDEIVAEAVGDNDRRLRCESAYRRFVECVSSAPFAPTVYDYRRRDRSTATVER